MTPDEFKEIFHVKKMLAEAMGNYSDMYTINTKAVLTKLRMNGLDEAKIEAAILAEIAAHPHDGRITARNHELAQKYVAQNGLSRSDIIRLSVGSISTGRLSLVADSFYRQKEKDKHLENIGSISIENSAEFFFDDKHTTSFQLSTKNWQTLFERASLKDFENITYPTHLDVDNCLDPENFSMHFEFVAGTSENVYSSRIKNADFPLTSNEITSISKMYKLELDKQKRLNLDMTSLSSFGDMRAGVQINEFLDNTYGIGMSLPLYDDDILKVFDRLGISPDLKNYMEKDMYVDTYALILSNGNISTAFFLNDSNANTVKYSEDNFLSSTEKKALVEALAIYPDIMADLDRCCAYEEYKKEWINAHVPEETQRKTYRAYLDDVDSYSSFADFLSERGYDGALYACFDEFCDNDYDTFVEGYGKFHYAFETLSKANPLIDFSKASELCRGQKEQKKSNNYELEM